MPFWYSTNSAGDWELASNDDGRVPFKLKSTGHPEYKFPSNNCVLFDDFLGDVIADEWSAAKGTDTAGIIATINAQDNGVVRLTSGDAGAGADAADASVLTGGLNWSAAQGGLVMEARVALPATTALNICVGFSDVLATTTVEVPFEIGSTDDITSNAANAVCWVFDTGGATDNWRAIGVKAGTDTAILEGGSAPSANTFEKLRIELDSSGNATLYLNDIKKGSLANAVTAATQLTPHVSVMTRTTAVKTVDVDYVFVAQDR